MKKTIFKVLHPLLWLIMQISYLKSRVKDKENRIIDGYMDFIRIQQFARDVRVAWNYQLDPFWGLWNTISPPTTNELLREGDCDDYASVLIGRYIDTSKSYLYTYFPTDLRRAHSVPVFVLKDGSLLTINWGESYIVKTQKDLIKLYEDIFGVTIFSNHYAKWDNKKGRFRWTRKVDCRREVTKR